MRTLLVLALLAGVAHAQPERYEGELPATAAEVPEVVLLTFGVGEVIFEKFGHAAICLHYVASGKEPVCFNYGVTNFEAGSELIWSFLRGKQQFWVDPEAWSTMTYFYRAEDRDIFMQILPLSDAEARAVEQKLFHDLEAEHRYYTYDHFGDNCTTRIRDLLDAATHGRLRAGADQRLPLTFRQLGHRGLAELPALVVLSDFIVGRQLDERPTIWQGMFHPEVLRKQVEVALGAKPKLLYQRRGPPFPTSGPTGRAIMLLIAAAFALPLAVALWRRRFVRAALAWSAVFLVVWGIVIWGLAIISSIPGLRWNEAVLVYTPLDLALPFVSEARRVSYARARVAILVLVSLLCAIGVFRQPLWIPIACAFMPLALVAFASRGARS